MNDLEQKFKAILAAYPNDNFTVIAGPEFMVENYIWIEHLPKRVRFEVDDDGYFVQTRKIGPFEMGGLAIVNETQLKKEITQDLWRGLITSLPGFEQRPGRSIRPHCPNKGE